MKARTLLPPVGWGALTSACGIGLLATSGWLITRASERPPVLALSVAIGLVQAFALGRGLARYLQRIAVHRRSLDRLAHARLDLYDRLEPLVPGGMPRGGTGAALAGFLSDTEAVTSGYAKHLTASVDAISTVALGSAVAMLIDPALGLILLAGCSTALAASVALAVLGRRAAAVEAAEQAVVADAVVETVRMARELAAYGRQDLVRSALGATAKRSGRAAMRRARVAGAARAVVIVLTGASMTALVAAGVGAARAGRLSGVLLAVVVFAGLATFDQCAAVPAVLADTAGADAARRRLRDIAAVTPPVQEPALDHSPPSGSTLPVALEGASVTLAGREVLSGADLALAPGERVALTGPSGSGKSTAVHALLHFAGVTAGTARIGSVDVATMTRPGIARHLAWMSDHTHLFAASVRDNLRIARPSAADTDCEEALARVGLGTWLRSLPDGLDTALGAGGRPVSAGERQRIGLARALLGTGHALLLDEPTAHVDAQSAPGLVSEMLDAASGRSVLVVTHDPAVECRVDTVLRMDAGRVYRAG